MESNSVIKVLIVLVILLAAFTAILYVYPFKPTFINNTQNLSNSIKLGDFISSYNINLSMLSDKDLYYFYGGLSNNSIVFGCNYEMEPLAPTIPINSSEVQKEYSDILRDISLVSMCSVENYTNCTAAESQLYQFIDNKLNSTEIIQLFNITYSQMKAYYSEIAASGLQNYSIVNPLKYDLNLFKNSTNYSDIINSLLKMKQMTINIVFQGNGHIFNYNNETGIYSPFQFQVYRLINATSCSYSKIFNLIVDPSYFSSPAYSYVYKDLGNYTNICIVNKGNSCSQNEIEKLNISFYAN